MRYKSAKIWAKFSLYEELKIGLNRAKFPIYDLLTNFPEYAAIDRMHANMLYGSNWDYGHLIY